MKVRELIEALSKMPQDLDAVVTAYSHDESLLVDVIVGCELARVGTGKLRTGKPCYSLDLSDGQQCEVVELTYISAGGIEPEASK